MVSTAQFPYNTFKQLYTFIDYGAVSICSNILILFNNSIKYVSHLH